jgi:hypothetical protein
MLGIPRFGLGYDHGDGYDDKVEFPEIEWIHLAQDRDQWRTTVNTIINLRGSIKCREYIKGLSNLTSQEGPCSMQVVVECVELYVDAPIVPHRRCV